MDQWIAIVVSITFGGLIGGLLAELVRAEAQGAVISKVDLNRLVQRCVIGMGAALVGYAVLNVLPTSAPAGVASTEFIRLLGFTTVCGFVGSRLLADSARKLFKDLETKVDSGLAVERKLTSAQQYYATGRYDLAIEMAKEGLLIDPSSKEAKWILALAVSRVDEKQGGEPRRKGYERAIELLTEALELDPLFHAARYDRACIRAAATGDAERVIEDLEKVFTAKPQYRKVAATDDDLTALIGASPKLSQLVAQI